MASKFINEIKSIRLTITYTIRLVTQLVKQDIEAIRDVNNVFQTLEDVSVGVGERIPYVDSLESEKQGVINRKASVVAEFDAEVLFLQEQIDEINALP